MTVYRFDEKKLRETLKMLTDSEIASMKEVMGGYTLAKRLIVRTNDGKTVFVKVATNSDTKTWLRDEYNFYKQSDYRFHPQMLFWEDAEMTILGLEDLSEADWSYAWSNEKVNLVFQSLKEMSEIKGKIDLPTSIELHSDLFCWKEIKNDPTIFTNSGIAPQPELENALQKIIEAASRAKIDGDQLVHMDIRSDNICFTDNGAVFVDWNHACIGNAKLDIAFWLPSVFLENGPEPWSFEFNEPELIALLIGYYALNSSLEPPHEGSQLRVLQKNYLKVLYEWFKILAKI